MSTKSAKPKKGGVGVGGDSKAGCDGKCKLDGKKTGDNEVNDKDDNEVNNEIRKKGQKTFKSKNLFTKLSKSKKVIELDFLTSGTRLAFTELRQAFVKTPIFYYFEPERYIRVEIDVSGYAIGGVLSQLILDNSGQ